MKICVQGYKPIVIPSDLTAKEVGPFDGHTSYAAKVTTRLNKRGYRERTLPSKLLCLEAIKARMIALGGYKSFAEPLAGVGLSARIFNNGKLYLNDTDEGCRRILELNFGGEPTGLDVLTMKLPKADAVFLDFNDFTLKRYNQTAYGVVLGGAFKTAKKFVILNDCSIFYFRYGKGSFETYSKYLGQKINSIEDYLHAVRAYHRREHPEWWLVHAAYFRDSSFQLFSREVAPLKIDYIKNPKPIVTVQS